MHLNIPGYEILERIGHGGMAEVYRARHLRLERHVALKVMLEQFARDSTFCDRFVREARIAARLNHPNIVQIFDVDQHEHQLFLSMEYVDGGDLLEKRRQPLSYQQILHILEQLARALDHAHGQGYIHRDIKPANILFRSDDSLVVSDFGIARAIHSDTNMTAAGSMVGTPNYMSPEQAKGLDLDGRADLYSMAVIAYQMLTGELPYVGDSTISIAIKHISEPIPTLGDHLSPLQEFFNRALAKNADERYATGAEMVDALRRELAHMPDTVAPTVVADKARLASSFHEKKTEVKPTREAGQGQSATTRETLLRPQADKPAEETLSSSQAETLPVSDALQGDFISHAPPSIRKVLRRINEITGVVVHPKRRGLAFALGMVMVVAAGVWLFRLSGTGLQNVTGIKPASADKKDTALAPEQRMRISQLLENARQDVAAGRLSTPLGNNAYEKYLAVLAIAPGHAAANDGLNQVADRLLDAARTALAEDRWDDAGHYLVQAKTVAPQYPGIAAVERDLEIARQNREQQISQLFLEANQAKNRAEDDQVITSLGRILELDGSNATARNELLSMAQSAVGSAREAVTGKRYTEAENHLVTAKDISAVLNDDKLASEIETLRNTIDTGQSRQQKQDRLNRYLSQAENAFTQGTYVDGDNSALAYYRQALQVAPDNRRARQGIEQVKQALSKRAQAAIDNLRLENARQDIRHLRAIDARFAQLSQLESNLARAEKQAAVSRKRDRQVVELYDRAERYLEAQRADGADKIYQRIARISPDDPGLPALGKKIADGYVFLAQHEIDGKDWDDVNVWVERGLKHVPDHKKLIEMRRYAEEQKKNSKPGFFH